VTPGSHAADVDIACESDIEHTDPVAQDCTTREGTAGINRQNADLLSTSRQQCRQSRNQRTLARAGRTSQSNDIGASCARIDATDHLGATWIAILDPRDRTRDRSRIAGQDHPA